MGMRVTELVDYLREKGPYDLPLSPTASQGGTPPPLGWDCWGGTHWG